MHIFVSDQLLGSSILAISILDSLLPLARFSFLCIFFLCTKLPYVDQLSETRNLEIKSRIQTAFVNHKLCQQLSHSQVFGLTIVIVDNSNAYLNIIN